MTMLCTLILLCPSCSSFLSLQSDKIGTNVINVFVLFVEYMDCTWIITNDKQQVCLNTINALAFL